MPRHGTLDETLMGSALLVGLVTLVVGAGLALVLRLLPSMRLQMAGLAVVAVTLPIVAIVLSGTVMLDMGASGEFTAVCVAAGVASLVGAFLLAHSIAARIERVRNASVRLAGGDLGERAPGGGPAEIAQLADAFNAMADHLEEVFGARRELVAWASHDLRAPVTSLQAMLEAIDDGVVDPRHYVAALQSQVRLLAALVDDLFELACLDAGAASLDLEPADVGALVADVVGRFQLDAHTRGCTLDATPPEHPAVARCEPDKVERVLVNLVTNALRYTPSGGRVAISVARTDCAVLVAVEDSGIGIAPDALERVFEPFFRADPSRVRADGNAGLGLAIARGLIDAQGGRIWAERPGECGTRICFALPAAADPPADAHARAEPAAVVATGSSVA